jgi:hypothetical protein
VGWMISKQPRIAPGAPENTGFQDITRQVCSREVRGAGLITRNQLHSHRQTQDEREEEGYPNGSGLFIRQGWECAGAAAVTVDHGHVEFVDQHPVHHATTRSATMVLPAWPLPGKEFFLRPAPVRPGIHLKGWPGSPFSVPHAQSELRGKSILAEIKVQGKRRLITDESFLTEMTEGSGGEFTSPRR